MERTAQAAASLLRTCLERPRCGDRRSADLPNVRGGFLVGEIWLRGTSVAAGYWRREAETCATFGARIAGEALGACWLRTGNLGYLCAGALVVTGRLKDVIVIRGANIDPGDIEAAASSLDACPQRAA